MPQGIPLETLLTNSTRNLWTTCQQQYVWAVVEKLRRKDSGRAIRFGTAWHAAMERYHQVWSVTGSLPAALAAVEEWADAEGALVAGMQDEPRLRASIHEVCANVATLLGMYAEQRSGDFDEWVPVAVERSFRFDLPMARTQRNSGLDYGGKIDLIMRKLREPGVGKLVVWEHKSTTVTSPDSYERGLLLDGQCRGYVYAAHRLYDDQAKPSLLDPGACVADEVMYNVVRSRAPSEPATTKCKKCKGYGFTKAVACAACGGQGCVDDPVLGDSVDCPACGGRGATRGAGSADCEACAGTGVGGISRKQIDTTPEVYRRVLRRYPHVQEADYADFIDGLRNAAPYFYRFNVAVLRDEMRQWFQDTLLVGRQIATAIHRSPMAVTHNLAACNMPGRPCRYRELCYLAGRQDVIDALYERVSDSPAGAPELASDPEVEGE